MESKSGVAGRGARIAASLASLALAAGAAAADLDTVEVAARLLPRTFAAEGVVEAVRQSTLAAQVSGRIVEFPVKAGDRVSAGQVLARIDARTAEQAVAASLSQVAEAEANLGNAKRRFERNRELAAQRFVSQAAVDQAEAEYKGAQAQVAALRAGAGQAVAQKSLATIAAPYAGVIGATHVELGDMATPGRALVTVFDPRDLRVVATLSQAALAQWQRGQAPTVEIQALGRPLAPAAVTVLPLADARTHTTRVRLDLPPVDGLLPGQYARVLFPTGAVHALVVPAGALLRRGEVTAVYVVRADGRATLRQVRVGESFAGGLVEILAGLAPGERIAADPIRAGFVATAPIAAR